MTKDQLKYRTLDADEIIKTSSRLTLRIQERFPDSGLGRVSEELTRLAKEGRQRAKEIARPNWILRGFSTVMGVSCVGLIFWIVLSLGFRDFRQTQDFVSFLEPAIGSLVFVGAAIFFVLSIEDRLKRRRALQAMHELHAMAHVVDMHQLTKDPERVLFTGPDTESSPERTMSPFLLSRYLDYSTEMLSVISKVGAIYAQGFPDHVATTAADQVDSTTTGLSQKIWQKMMILSELAKEIPPESQPQSQDS